MALTPFALYEGFERKRLFVNSPHIVERSPSRIESYRV
jgi:hypothetical protein